MGYDWEQGHEYLYSYQHEYTNTRFRAQLRMSNSRTVLSVGPIYCFSAPLTKSKLPFAFRSSVGTRPQLGRVLSLRNGEGSSTLRVCASAFKKAKVLKSGSATGTEVDVFLAFISSHSAQES